MVLALWCAGWLAGTAAADRSVSAGAAGADHGHRDGAGPRQRAALERRHALLLAAAIMAGLDPQTVRDMSFQLSFAATAGILYVAGPLRRWCLELIARALRVETVQRAVDAAFGRSRCP